MRNVALGLLRNYTEVGSLLSWCGRENQHRLGSSIHASIIKNFILFLPNTTSSPRNILLVWNSLIAMYSNCGLLPDASKVFDDMPLRDTISWNSIISAFLSRGHLPHGFLYFKTMRGGVFHSDKCPYDRATLTTVLSACARPNHLHACSMLHSLTISGGYIAAAQVGNALITAYFRCGHPLSAKTVFDGMAGRNVIAWTAMVSGLAQCRLFDESLLLFREMLGAEEANSVTYASSLLACSGMPTVWEGRQIHGLVEKSGLWGLHVEGALMDLYSKRGMIEDALRVFYSCADPDEVVLTVMLVGFAQNGTEQRAFEMFAEMVGRGVEIDENMVSAVLGAFGRASKPFGLALGKQIHSLAVKKCFFPNTFVSNGLVNMYSKCGELKDSVELFRGTQLKNSVSWNSVIAAFGRHGHASEALRFYRQMLSDGIEPTDVTFVSLLHACSHAGYVGEGMELLRSMKSLHGISPRAEHYACVVDMLGRAGQLEEARGFIEGLQLHVESGVLLWQALLGCCRLHGDVEMGRYAAEKLVMLTPDCTAAYVLLSNIYSADGGWEERATTMKRMKEKGVKKETGVSWIELGNKFHSFVVEDEMHPQAERIYEVLDELCAFTRDEDHPHDHDECSDESITLSTTKGMFGTTVTTVNTLPNGT